MRELVLIKQSWKYETKPRDVYRKIEKAGRTCYKSEAKITAESAEKFVRGLIKSGHHSVLEHVSASVRIVTDRGVSHELVRHRLAAYSQESTRYCNYRGSMTVIIPVWLQKELSFEGLEDTWQPGADKWVKQMGEAMNAYNDLLNVGWSPQQARSVLPNSVKTEIVMTANMREWRHVFSLRCSDKAHPQMRELMRDIYRDFAQEWPVLFEDVTW